MGGDGMGGVILMIMAASAGMIICGFVFFFLLGHFLGKLRSLTDHSRILISLLAGVLGIAVAIMAVAATFYESTFSPSPEILLELPDDFTQDRIILLEDVKAVSQLQWSGMKLPFFGIKTKIDVPRSGIARVRNLEGIKGGGDIQFIFDDGSHHFGSSFRTAPAGIGASYMIAIDRSDKPSNALPLDDVALAEHIVAQETKPRK